MPNRARLCALDDLAPGTARGYGPPSDPGSRSIILVRFRDTIRAYRNVCPHVGTPLDWSPDTFLDESGTLLQCSTHGALFRIEDGLCLHGPCANRSLTPVPIEVDDEGVWLTALPSGPAG